MAATAPTRFKFRSERDPYQTFRGRREERALNRAGQHLATEVASRVFVPTVPEAVGAVAARFGIETRLGDRAQRKQALVTALAAGSAVRAELTDRADGEIIGSVTFTQEDVTVDHPSGPWAKWSTPHGYIMYGHPDATHLLTQNTPSIGGMQQDTLRQMTEQVVTGGAVLAAHVRQPV